MLEGDMAQPLQPDRTPRVDARVVAVALAGFWSCFVALNTLQRAIFGGAHPGEAFVRRVSIALVGMALAWLMYRVLLWLRAWPLRSRIGLAALMSLPAAALFATTNFLVFDVFAPVTGDTCQRNGLPCTLHDAVAAISELAINWAFVFTAWGMLYLSLASAVETRAADRRAAADREAARLAEVRALRYQVNPHFLFNLLNALSSLVIRRRLAEAEALIGEIGQFFRYSLAADPVADSALGDEVAMQVRYLDLERRRFPSRLVTELDIPAGLEAALVPSLILQPLVENAIKHGLGRTARVVTIAIRASEAPGKRLRILVEDDARPGDDGRATRRRGEQAKGLGIGLRNVADRLRARFGAQASCSAAPIPAGGFRVELLMPLVLT
jgi:two-component system LytT family sensor kinase